jgi:NTE family protein
MTVSLVLGAGGRAGVAYHAGVLLALQLHGVDIERPCAVTGTSAGSLVAALLSIGVRPEDLCAYSVGAVPRSDVGEVIGSIEEAEQRRPDVSLSALARLADLRRGIGVMTGIGSRNLVHAVTQLVPGIISLHERTAFIENNPPRADSPPWRICAATESGERRVISAGRGAPIPAAAVAASCAVPGIYRPVRFGDERLVDGGVYSSTNADLAADDDADTVVVVAPMCGDQGIPIVTRAARRQLEAEIAVLEAARRSVVVFRPTPSVSSLMGVNLLSARRSTDITREALLSAGEIIADHPVLAERAARPRPVRDEAVSTK